MGRVHYNVQGIRQGPHNTCWLACFRMLVQFRLSVGREVNAQARALLDPELVRRFEIVNRGLDPDRFERIAREFGLSSLHIAGLTRPLRPGELDDPFAAYDVLSRRGPFTLGGLLPNGAGHAVVICGANTEADCDVEFIDPRFGDMRHMGYATLRTGFRPDGGALFVF
ncbi:MAG: papain-like cysteine protease family protein [Pyrinomonadaceae bacterium]